ncbi:MAG: substrate-binding domain-containing protein, partial [Pirellulales bacterium]|nr:substrate-binding domain-containing protein [Pirellulales bacterium]
LNVPVVLVDNQHPGGAFPSVSIDDRAGARAATRHLIALGHRRIAFIGDRYGFQSHKDRLAGCRQALEKANLEIAPERMVLGDGKLSGGIAATKELLSLDRPPTGIVCYNDVTALGALHAINRRGLTVPGDVSLAGFDDIALAAHSQPPLTTIRQPKRSMAQRAIHTLLQLINEEPAAKKHVRIPGRLIIRESTARPRRRR